ncbi:MAG TPA: nicotinamide-nucleotide adenylyltransferase [Candidatus Nanoarchaeia archaeon]|nr:nicotinamide-nucleotide adenylyltransferase [Candidatus Nanoarchaeia archaeon]
MTTGLFIGRFQPLHNAHLKDIEIALSEVDRLIIAIGSSNEENTEKNPFSMKERKEMIEKTLRARGITRWEIVDIPDCAEDEEWMKCLKKKAPKYDIAFMSNDSMESFFSSRKIKAKRLPFVQGRSASRIRKLIQEGKRWRDYVPKEVEEYLLRKNLVKRIKDLNQKSP